MFSRKGISLPVNMLVILAISIIVLLAVVAFFMGTFSGQAGAVRQQAKVNSCCQAFTTNNGCFNDITSDMSNNCQQQDGWYCVDWDNDNTDEYCGDLSPGESHSDWKQACACPNI